MSVIRKLASQTAVYGLSTILGRLTNFLLTPLLVRVFAPAEYGVIGEMYAYVAFFIVILTYGMETAFFRFSQKEENNPKVFSTAFISVLITSVAFIIIMSGFAQPVANLLRYPSHPEYIIYLSLCLAFDAISSVAFALLRRENRPGRFALIKNTGIFSNVVLTVYFVWICPHILRTKGIMLPFFDAGIGVGYVFIVNVVSSAIVLPLLYAEIIQAKYGFDKALWRKMVVYALPLMIVGLGGMVNETLDRAIMKYLLPAGSGTMSQLGIYSANYKLAVLLSLFIQAFRFAAEPFFFSQAKSDDKRLIYAKVMDYFVLVCLLIFLMVTLFIDQFKQLIDEPYYEGLKVVPVLLLANLFLGIYVNLSIWYKLSDQTNKGVTISLAGAAITILLNFWWIPLFGYMGAAWATLICYFTMMMICYLMGKKYYPIPYHVKKICGYILFALALFFADELARRSVSEPVPLFIIGSLLIAAFFALAWRIERKNLRA